MAETLRAHSARPVGAREAQARVHDALAAVGLDDPADRIRAIDRISQEWRHEPAIPYSNLIAGALNLLPQSVTGGMLKHVDFLASNVPGFRDSVYVGGARVTGFYPFGPTIGASANFTLMSYAGTCNVGVTADLGAVADPEAFIACLIEGFEEVLQLGGGQGNSSSRPT